MHKLFWTLSSILPVLTITRVRSLFIVTDSDSYLSVSMTESCILSRSLSLTDNSFLDTQRSRAMCRVLTRLISGASVSLEKCLR